VIVEENLREMLDMHLLATEYPTTTGGRIDTLAVDASGAPVIIEYKLSQNHR
jgi:RecB family endonuclease NucS